MCFFFFSSFFFSPLFQAVANSTSATFLRVVGSELIQKYLGDGPKLVRELFRVADDLSPAIVFIDEIDAIGTKRQVQELYYMKEKLLKLLGLSVKKCKIRVCNLMIYALQVRCPLRR